MKAKLILIPLMGLCISISLCSVSFATPFLGVATDTDTYVYTDATPPSDVYINYFASTLISGSYEGFLVGASGSHLTVFTKYDPSVTQIYLLANNNGQNLPITFGGDSLASLGDTGKANGYKDSPYYGLALSTNLSDWTVHNFETTFYLYDREIDYAGTLPDGFYFFSAAETNGVSGLQFQGAGQKDNFSPATSSASLEENDTPVPEPSCLVPLGMLLFGLMHRMKVPSHKVSSCRNKLL